MPGDQSSLEGMVCMMELQSGRQPDVFFLPWFITSHARQSAPQSMHMRHSVHAHLGWKHAHNRTCAGEMQLESEPEALSAFPEMDKRSDDLYSSYLNFCILSATTVDVNDSVGKSTRKPYYFVHTVRST